MRRGLPYGEAKDRTRNDGNHGIIIMMINADINRQFEFVQQQWINYGNDFQSASEKEILLGNHSDDPQFPSKALNLSSGLRDRQYTVHSTHCLYIQIYFSAALVLVLVFVFVFVLLRGTGGKSQLSGSFLST